MGLPEYQQLPAIEEQEEDRQLIGEAAKLQRQTLFTTLVALRTYLFIWLATIALSLLLGIAISSWSQKNGHQRQCWNMHTTYSPASAEVDTSYHDVHFNGTLGFESEFRGELTEELDAAWQKLETLRMTWVSEEELEKYPYDIDTVRLPEELGGQYMGSIEVVHQLHCLNFMRKASIWNYDYYKNRSGEFRDPPDMVHTHFDHCADMLRQNLMCNADVSLITYRWVKNHREPYPNFNNWHSCRNYDDIIEWAKGRQIAPLRDASLLRPQPGEKVWDTPP